MFLETLWRDVTYGARMLWLDRRLQRELGAAREAAEPEAAR